MWKFAENLSPAPPAAADWRTLCAELAFHWRLRSMRCVLNMLPGVNAVELPLVTDCIDYTSVVPSGMPDLTLAVMASVVSLPEAPSGKLTGPNLPFTDWLGCRKRDGFVESGRRYLLTRLPDAETGFSLNLLLLAMDIKS